jgi:DNA-directed RNA polymerase-3 subunit RPC5
VVGVLRDGELHLTPLRGIVQLRPSLAHLDQAVAGRRHGSAAPDLAATDGDTTESEGEEAKPVTVKFARRDVGRNRRVTWSELSSRKDSQEGWVDLNYCPLTSQQACDERKLLFSSDDCPLLSSNLPPDVYLNRLCPLQGKEEEREPSEPPGGAVSLSKLKALPVTTQVHDLLTSTGVLTLAQLSSLLQCGRGQLPAYLEALQQHGVLVQGCWVVSSHTLYPSEMHASLRDARDYLLYCFSQTRCLARKDVAVLTKVPHEAVRQVVASLTSGSGLEFKMATDTDFIHKYPHVVHQQEEKWRKRFEELKSALNLPKDLQKSPSGSGDSRKPASKKLKTSVAQ